MMGDKLSNPAMEKKLLSKVIEKAERVANHLGHRPVLMEVCGTHTVALSRSGLRDRLREVIELRSGPGCPVCVTAVEDLDRMIALSQFPKVMIVTFGDMVRVPGSMSSLEKERARGAEVRMIYSPLEAIELAKAYPDREIILIGVGFETTAPLIGICIEDADQYHLTNFSILSLHKRVQPALRNLLEDLEFSVDGLILPGHVCAIEGRQAYNFIAKDYEMPAVVTGFESLDMMGSIFILLEMLEKSLPQVVNGYTRVVKEEGNIKAQRMIRNYFNRGGAIWRGLGFISDSGLTIKEKYGNYDANRKFSVKTSQPQIPKGCCCGDLMKGKMMPYQCPLLGTCCTPTAPVGPCMVSSEGPCGAYYLYEHYNRK